MQLRDARLVYADFRADLLHRHFAVVIEADDLALAPRQRLNCHADALTGFGLFVGGVGSVGFGRHERGRQRAFVHVLAGGERRRRFDGVDADDRAAEPFLVGTDTGGEVGQRRLVAQLAAQRLAGGVELAALAAHAARPGVAAQRVDHRPADAPFGERLEFDPAVLVEPVRRVDQAEDPVLNEVADVDRVRHRRRHAARERLHEGKARNDTSVLTGDNGLNAHSVTPVVARKNPKSQSRFGLQTSARYRNCGTNCRVCVQLHVTGEGNIAVTSYAQSTCCNGSFRNAASRIGRKSAEIVKTLTKTRIPKSRN